MAPKTRRAAEPDFSDDSDEFVIGRDDRHDRQGDDKPKGDFVWDEESPNLVEVFQSHPEGEKALEEIGLQVVQDFDSGWEAGEEYRERVADDWRMFIGDLPPKTGAFKHTANVHVPVALENLTRIVYRAFSEMFDDWSRIFTVLPVGANDDVIADILTKHGNWQLTYQIKDFYRQMMRAMFSFFGPGDVVAHSYYDERRKCNAHEVLSCDEFVVPFVYTSTQPDFSDVPWRVKVLNRYRHELQAMKDTWVDVDKVLARKQVGMDDDPESMLADVAAETRGIDKPTDQRAAPYRLLHYEGWTDKLPGQDKDRFIQAVVDYHTKRVLHLMIYEEANWQEKLRYEQQTQEHRQYADAVAQHREMLAQLPKQRADFEAQLQQQAMQGIQPDPVAVEQQMQQLDPANHPHPLPPAWMGHDSEGADDGQPEAMPDPEDPKNLPKEPHKEPINMFSHGVCIEPIAGGLGFGFGRMQSDYNKGANTVLSQFIDSATLGNVWGLITAGNLEFERPFSHAPGAINVAKGVTGEQLAKSIHEMKPGPANPQMLDVLNLIWNWGQSSAQAPEVLSGEPGKSGETFRGISARIEQATKQLSVPTRTFAKTLFGQILQNNAKLNEIYLPEEEVVQVNSDSMEATEELKLGRKMYERDYRVMIGADLRFASRSERVDEADQLVTLSSAQGPIPAMANNLAFQHRALSKALKARGMADMVRFLGPPPPAPETTFGLPPPPPPPPPGAPPAPGQPPGAPPGPPGPPGPPQPPPNAPAPPQPG